MQLTRLPLVLVFGLLGLTACKKDEEALPVPATTSITPAAAPAGATLTLKGTHFGAASTDNAVEFWQGATATAAPVTAATHTSLTVTVPETLTPGDYLVKVKAFGQTGVGSEFKVLPPGPVITRFWPLSARTSSKITIYGRNFSPVAEQNVVLLNREGYSEFGLKPEKATDTSLVVTPSGTPGDYTVQVLVNGQRATAPLKYNMTLNPPGISSNPFAPAFGAPGSSFLLYGINFNTYAEFDTVFFVTPQGPVAAPITRALEQALTVTVPAGLSPGEYPVSVHVSGQRTQSPVPFTVVPPGPTITSVSPTEVLAGEAVTITGTNFNPVPDQNTIFITREGTTTIAGVMSATTTSLTFSVGAYTSPGTFQVSVKTNRQTATTNQVFTVVAAPRITSITPASGMPNSTITINGNGFSPDVSSNQVAFIYGAGAAVPAVVTSATYNMLKATVPASLAAESLPYTVQVIVYGKTLEGQFTITAPANAPAITSYNGVSSVNRGATLTIIGTNLKATGAVTNVNFTPWPGGGVTTVVSGTPNAAGTSLMVTVPSGLAAGQYEVAVEVNQVYGSAPDILKVN